MASIISTVSKKGELLTGNLKAKTNTDILMPNVRNALKHQYPLLELSLSQFAKARKKEANKQYVQYIKSAALEVFKATSCEVAALQVKSKADRVWESGEIVFNAIQLMPKGLIHDERVVRDLLCDVIDLYKDDTCC